MALQKTVTGIIIETRIRTGQSYFSIKESDGNFIINVKSSPVQGKANKEIVKEIKKLFKADNVEIVKGNKSKNKVIKIDGKQKNIIKILNRI